MLLLKIEDHRSDSQADTVKLRLASSFRISKDQRVIHPGESAEADETLK